MFELSGVNYEEVLEQGDSIFSSSYREFELSGVRVIGIILNVFIPPFSNIYYERASGRASKLWIFLNKQPLQ